MRRIAVLSTFALLVTRGAAAAVTLPPPPGVAAAYVAEALRQNLGVALGDAELALARARLAEAQGAWQPRVDLVARYTRSDGGRAIDFPAGDLLNGAYRTLNEFLRTQGRPAAFGTVANQSVALLRPAEQETKVRVVQPLYRPELTRAAQAGRADAASREARLAAFRREVRLLVLTAYYGYLQAEAAVGILQAAEVLTTEALRVNRALAAAEKITEDRVLRAEADNLEVRQQVATAVRDRNAARSYFNTLLHRPVASPIERAEEPDLAAALPPPVAEVAAADGAIGRREELAALQEAVAAARELEELQRARLRPTLALAVEGGLQGERYRTGGDAGFVQGSLVAEWNLWDGRQRRSRIQQAQLERRKLELQLADTRQQLELGWQQAIDELTAATAGWRAADRRADASARAFDLVSRREREGLAHQLMFLEARHEVTRAELNRAIARFRLLTAVAALDRAAALSPLP